MHIHTGTGAFHFTADLSLSAAHLVQVGSTATGVQLSFSAELVEQTASRAQWSVCVLHWYIWYTCTLGHRQGLSTFTHFFPSTSPQSTSSSCPRLLPALTGDGRYYLHEGLGPQDESLVLRGENLLMAVSDHSCRYCETSSLQIVKSNLHISPTSTPP